MVQVIWVAPLAAGAIARTIWSFASNGRVKFRSIATESGFTSVTVMLPAPTFFASEDQAYFAPTPLAAPSKVRDIFGSRFSQGDHACHWWKSTSIGRIAAGAAAMVVERETAKLSGRVATHAARPASTTTAPARMA